MSEGRRSGPEDAAVDRFLASVRDACEAEEGLPAALTAGLRVALGQLAADPRLADQLTVATCADPDAEQRLLAAFGELLREAVAHDPRATPLPFDCLATFLVSGVRFRIAQMVVRDGAADLPRLLPSLLEGLLSYFFEPGEPRLLAPAALAA